jgi:cyclophilin family peptidyl-prolyl cis-trans isomerase
MRQLIRAARGLLHKRKPARGHSWSRAVRPRLESLEDRVTPTNTQILATGVLSGIVAVNGGTIGLPGIGVTLTGTTTTGRTVDVSTTTGSNGDYSFNSMLPGTYSVSRDSSPDGFTPSSQTLLSNVTLAQGQTSSGNNLGVGGLTASRVTLGFFLSGPSPLHVGLPAAGAGSAAGFSLDLAGNPIGPAGITAGSTTPVYVDLAANFFDPDTTNTTVTFNTSLGSFNVTLYGPQAPETVTNFLDYIAAGDYNNNLFHRLSNLSQTTAQNPVVTPFQVLQAGGFQVTTGAGSPASVTAITPITTFQPIGNEFSAALPDVAGTLAMARGSAPNSATSQFFFNLANNSPELGASNGGGFAVFGAIDPASLSTLTNLTSTSGGYTPTDVSTATSNSALVTLPLANGFTPGSSFPTGATVNDVLLINSITVPTAPTGHLSYSIVSNSNPSVATLQLGANTSSSTFSANQLKITPGSAGTTTVTLQISDNRGETVFKQFTITAS